MSRGKRADPFSGVAKALARSGRNIANWDQMPDNQTLVPARQFVDTNKARFPNESAEYRKARNALLAEEIELRRSIERWRRSGAPFL
jgi:hypothetical protein